MGVMDEGVDGPEAEEAVQGVEAPGARGRWFVVEVYRVRQAGGDGLLFYGSGGLGVRGVLLCWCILRLEVVLLHEGPGQRFERTVDVVSSASVAWPFLRVLAQRAPHLLLATLGTTDEQPRLCACECIRGFTRIQLVQRRPCACPTTSRTSNALNSDIGTSPARPTMVTVRLKIRTAKATTTAALA